MYYKQNSLISDEFAGQGGFTPVALARLYLGVSALRIIPFLGPLSKLTFLNTAEHRRKAK
jgi:hypothetical protein